MSFGVENTNTNMRLAFSGDVAAVYKPVILTTDNNNTNTIQPHSLPHRQHHQLLDIPQPQPPPPPPPPLPAPEHNLKRKRGRPRKYSPPPNHPRPLPLSPPPPIPSSAKKPRGRPPASHSVRKHLGSTAAGFTPHVITVEAGEDILSKIMSFSHNGPRAVCILSANGAVSNVTLCQAATSGGTVTYEGKFDILSLSGSLLPSENSGQHSRTGGLSISLTGPDGSVWGGGVAGFLMAASPVQMVVGSFIAEDGNTARRLGTDSGQKKLLTREPMAGSLPSHGTLSRP